MTPTRVLAFVAGLTLTIVSAGIASDDERFTRVTDEWRSSPYRQYDFWIGLGHANWRNKSPEEFFHQDQGSLATHWVYPTLDGKALLEFALGDEPIDDKGTRVQGFSVRYFDDAKERWVMAQEWPGPNQTAGVADQLQGFFRFGRIQVFSTYSRGEPLEEWTRRYTFSDIRPEGFIWHGVFTRDKGTTWSAGTLVEFSKVEPRAAWPKVGEPMPNYDGGRHCSDDLYRAFEDLAGEWRGTVERNGRTAEVALTGYKMLGGCAVMSYLELERDGKPFTLLEVRSPHRRNGGWWVFGLDSRRGSVHTYQIGEFENGAITLHDNLQYVIEDELENLSISQIPRDDSKAGKKTVWTTIGPEELSFEWWEREASDRPWRRDSVFRFQR